MNKRKLLASSLILLSVVLAVLFYMRVQWPANLSGYFTGAYINQYGPLTICIELFIASLYLYQSHAKTNFALAVFGFTALLDPLFNLTGIFSSLVPLYASVIFVFCALIALWIAFSNAFNSGRISGLAAFGSFLLSSLIELFFNEWYQYI